MKTPQAMPDLPSPPMQRRPACRAGSLSRRQRRAARSCRAPPAAATSGGCRAPVRPSTPQATAAAGIATVKPVRSAEVLRALRRSQGGVVAVPETEIAPALGALGHLGLFVEPTAATGAAALSLLLRDGTTRAGETTI